MKRKVYCIQYTSTFTYKEKWFFKRSLLKSIHTLTTYLQKCIQEQLQVSYLGWGSPGKRTSLAYTSRTCTMFGWSLHSLWSLTSVWAFGPSIKHFKANLSLVSFFMHGLKWHVCFQLYLAWIERLKALLMVTQVTCIGDVPWGWNWAMIFRFSDYLSTYASSALFNMVPGICKWQIETSKYILVQRKR